ncbi:MAG TPA: hypothetical protein VF260_02580 [Bacilli bacterium]
MGQFVRVASLNNVFEGQMFTEILEDRNIPYELKKLTDDAYGNLFEMTAGWAIVYAPESYREEIRALLEELRNAQPEMDMQ